MTKRKAKESNDPVTKIKSIQKFQAERSRPPIVAQNTNQKLHLKSLNNPHVPVIIATGCAGTGKTYLSACHAADAYLNGTIDTIILCRANIPTGRSLGAMKGDKDEKMSHWVAPMIDVLKGRLGTARFEIALGRGDIEYQPLETIRGRSFGGSESGAYVLIDEAQQLTIDEIKAVTTRIGENCKLILMGDLAQSDIKAESGLGLLLKLIDKYELPISVIDYQLDDICRSATCRMFVELFYKEGI
jgi:phosphate starvation-inducible PhoH-like protein|tara:strand:- start:189 stop:920 length:732 start_codon:yes stop_codon:yes gene_type:complete